MTSNVLQHYVVDASVVIAYFLEADEHHSKVYPYWESLEKSECRFHIPLLAVVETVAAINRRTGPLAYAAVAAERLRELTRAGYIVQYPLDDQRTLQAISAALQYGLRGADSIYVALTQELQFGLITTDNDFENYPSAIVLL